VDEWIEKKRLWVAHSEGETTIIGGGVLTPLEDTSVIDLGPFFVDVAVKGSGKGSEVLRLLKTTARDQLGARIFEITVINHRTDLFPFYEKRGFVRTGREFGYTAGNGFNESWLTRPSHFIVMHCDLTKPI